jgi:hypothetical protein
MNGASESALASAADRSVRLGPVCARPYQDPSRCTNLARVGQHVRPERKRDWDALACSNLRRSRCGDNETDSVMTGYVSDPLALGQTQARVRRSPSSPG